MQVVTKRTCVWIVDFVRHYGLPESRKFARMESRKHAQKACAEMSGKMKETGSYLLDVLFMGGLITASLCDFKKRKIPDAITGFLFLTGVAALFWMPQPSIKMRLAGAFIAGLPLFAAAVCRPGAVGGGDVKLMAAGGFFLGLSAVWDSLAFGMALAGGYCLCLMLLRNGREQKIALGPFLSMGLMFGMFRSMGA